ncbi:hypothetical protein [Streptomyces sp. NPDC004285]
MASRADIYLAAVLWLIVLVAALDMTLGNETAINGVVGAGIPALAFTVLAGSNHLRR